MHTKVGLFIKSQWSFNHSSWMRCRLWDCHLLFVSLFLVSFSVVSMMLCCTVSCVQRIFWLWRICWFETWYPLPFLSITKDVSEPDSTGYGRSYGLTRGHLTASCRTMTLVFWRPVTAHFVAPAQFVAGHKLCLRWRHMVSPPCTIWRLATKCAAVVHAVWGDKMCHVSLHILSSLTGWT